GGAKHVADQAEAPALVPEPVLQLGLLPFRAFPRCARTRELRTVGRVQHAQRRPQQRRRRQGVTLGSLRQVDPAMIDRGNEVRLAAWSEQIEPPAIRWWHPRCASAVVAGLALAQ